MSKANVRRGMRVVVDHGEPRGKQEAVVTQAPPFEETIGGETRRYLDEVKVKYPGSTPSRLRSIGVGELQERVPLESVEPK